MHKSLITLLLLFGLQFSSFQAHAAKYQDPLMITDAVEKYLKSHADIRQQDDTSIKVRTVSKRLKLTACSSPLQLELAPGANLTGKTSIKVSCSSPKNWNLYVTANIARFDDVYISSGVINKGKIIADNDVYLSRKNLASLPYGYITDKSQIVGKQVRRTVQAGHVVKPSQLRNPLLIKRGEIVKLQSSSPSFAISMEGVAMMDGALGDRIRVKNRSSKRVVEGKVTGIGTVSMAL